ncbi:MAG: SLBB domain-containing protein [Planctomycetaceae bacterium]
MKRQHAAMSVWLLLAMLAIEPGFATAQNVEIRPRGMRESYEPVRSFLPAGTESSAGRSTHIAVAGAVQQPAVYSVSSAVTFNDLIDAAGGPAPDASATVYVVRGGRVLQGFYDPTRRSQEDPVGPLTDQDVVILRPLPGVRTAHFQSVRTASDAPLAGSGVRPPSDVRPAYVVCLNTTTRPVLLPLSPADASLEVLLYGLLRLPREIDHTQVSLMPPTGQPPRDGTLQDGTVVVLPASWLQQGMIRPVEPFPPAIPLSSTSTHAVPIDAPRAKDAAADANPVDPATEQHGPSLSDNPGLAPGLSPGRQLLDPIEIPGVPFVVGRPPVQPPRYDADVVAQEPRLNSPSLSPTVNASRVEDADHRTTHVPTLFRERNPQPIDLTDETSTDSRVLPAAATMTTTRGTPAHSATIRDRLPERTAAAYTGSRSDSLTVGRAMSASTSVASNTREQPAAIDGEAAKSAPQNGSSWPVVIGTFVAAIVCLGGSYFWSRRDRQQLRSLRHQAYAGVAREEASDLQREAPLQQLINNRLPVVEEPAGADVLVPLHGKTIGHRRLIFDTAHAEARQPHFLAREDGSRARRQMEHLAAAAVPTRARKVESQPVATEATVTPSAAHSPADTTKRPVTTARPTGSRVRYDIVEPETARQPEAATRAADYAASVDRQADRLAKALQLLKGGGQ